MRTSLKTKLLQRLRTTGEWHSKGSICDSEITKGYLHEYIGRELRHMAERRIVNGEVVEPVIEVSYYKGKKGQKLSRYRATPRKVKEVYNIPELDKQLPIYE